MSVFNAGGRPEKTADFNGRKLTAKQIMDETGLSYMAVYRKYFQRKNVKPAKVAKRGARKKEKLAIAEKDVPAPAKPDEATVDPQGKAADSSIVAEKKQTPLEYMLSVLNDPTVEDNRRDRMAAAAAPYLHPKANVDKNKKEHANDRAAEAGKGKFATGRAPKVVIFSRK